MEKKTGDFVKEGDVIAVLHTNKPESVKEAEERILKATEISSEPVEKNRSFWEESKDNQKHT